MSYCTSNLNPGMTKTAGGDRRGVGSGRGAIDSQASAVEENDMYEYYSSLTLCQFILTKEYLVTAERREASGAF